MRDLTFGELYIPVTIVPGARDEGAGAAAVGVIGAVQIHADSGERRDVAEAFLEGARHDVADAGEDGVEALWSR